MEKFSTLLYRHFQLFVILLFITITYNSNGQEQNKNKQPVIQYANAIGNEFWFTIPPPYKSGDYSSDSVRIFVSCSANHPVLLEIPGKSYKESKMTDVTGTAVFAIPLSTACPWEKNGTSFTPEDKIYRDAGIHISSEYAFTVAVQVYSSDSFTALPVSSLGKSYVVSTYGSHVESGASMPAITACVAVYNETDLIFKLGGNSKTTTTGGLASGQSKAWALNRGDVLTFACDSNGFDLTGSTWSSNKPICVISGNSNAIVPSDNGKGAYTVETDIPYLSWGNVYPVPKIPGRKYSSVIRVLAKEKNTNIFRDSVQIATLPLTSGKEGEGWLEMRLTPLGDSPASAIITGSAPISVIQYNTGIREDGYPDPSGAPSACMMISKEQFTQTMKFATPGYNSGAQFTDNYINLIYCTDSSGNIPDDLKICRIVDNKFKWEKVKDAYPGASELFPKRIKGRQYAVKNIKLPGAGVYAIKAYDPFMAYSYGFDESHSYANPVPGAYYYFIEDPDTLWPLPAWEVHCDGSVVGDVQDRPADEDIRSNMAVIYLDSSLSNNYKLDYNDFLPGVDSSASWSLAVIDPGEDARAVVTFVDRRGNDTTITIDYQAFKVKIEPELIYKNHILSGTTVTDTFTVTNYSTTTAMTVNRLQLKNNSIYFHLDDVSLPFVLQAGESRKFSISFRADFIGEYKDSIGVGDTCIVRYTAEAVAVVDVEDVGEDHAGKASAMIIPNPALAGSALLCINSETETNATVNIFNSIGLPAINSIPVTLSTGENRIGLDLGLLPAGVYYIAVNFGNRVERVRFVRIR